MEKLQLRSERLILRPHRKEDLPALFECFSDTEAMKYWSSAPHTSLQQTEAKIEEWSRVTPGLELVIEFESETIGRCGYFDSDLGHEIGYLLNRKHWGKGFGTEAVHTFLKHIFSTTEDENFTIVADVDPNNIGSIKLLEKLGFNETGRKERTLCINGTWFDSVFFNLKKKDFKN